MLAIIMAGGEGERLRPMTCTRPKPMVPLLDRPILSYAFQLLKENGVSKAALTLGYLPDVITDEFGDGSETGLSLQYFTEEHPLGTAGGVKQAESFLTETFCVLSGDGITDAPLRDALAFHKKSGAKATIIAKRVKNPTDYGLIEASDDGRILSFLEKPCWGQVTTDLANTGIYILEPEVLSWIPENTPYDFGRDLFPMMLQRNEPMYMFETSAYWCDIGDIGAYLQAHRDALEGKIASIPVPKDGIIRMPGAIVSPDCVVESPAFIGAGVKIESGAHIGAYSVLGSGSVVRSGAVIKRAVLHENAEIDSCASVGGCIIERFGRIGKHASVFEDAVIGENTMIGSRACIKPGVKIWPGKQIPECLNLAENVIWGERCSHAFDGVSIKAGTPSEAAKAGEALAWKLKLKTALVGKSASSVAAAQARALSAGLCAQGVQVYETGECTLPQLRFALSTISLDAAIYALGDSVTPIRSDQTYLSSNEKKALESALSRQNTPRPYTGITKPIERLGRIDLNYLTFLKTAAVGSIRRFGACVFSQREQLLYLADHAFRSAGFHARVEWEEELMEPEQNEVGIYLTENGEECVFADRRGKLSCVQMELLTAWAFSENGETTVYAPPFATHALDAMCKDMNMTIEYAKSDANLWAKDLKQKSPYQYHMRFDGLYRALNILSHLNEKALSLESFLESLPNAERAERRIEIDFNKRAGTMRRLSCFAPKDYERDEWFFKGKNGCAWIRADDDHPYCYVTAEAMNHETAEEICDLFANLLEQAGKES